MGEIGISRTDFLYHLRYWELSCIIQGYRQRERTMHILTRLQTFWLVKCSMAKHDSIRDPSDLWPLQWDEEDAPDEGATLTPSEQESLQTLMQTIKLPK